MKRFVADGVHQTSVADIVADVGVTERTFYRHFPSKHAVIFADYDIGFEWFARALALRPHGEPITVSVRKAVDAFPFDFAMVREAATIRSRDLDQDIITTHIRRMRDQVADEIGRFIHQRSTPTADGAMIADIAAHSLATAVFVALEAWMSRKRRARYRRTEPAHRHRVERPGRRPHTHPAARRAGLIRVGRATRRHKLLCCAGLSDTRGSVCGLGN